MAKKSSNPKYQKYLNAKVRIKNKTTKLLKRLKTIKKEISIEHIKRDSRIGRKKEGFTPESFKHPKKETSKFVKKENRNEPKISSKTK